MNTRNNNSTFDEILYRSTFDDAAVGICHLSIDLRFLRANNKLLGLLNIDSKLIQMQSFLDFILPNDKEKCIDAFNLLYAGKIASFSQPVIFLIGDMLIHANIVSSLKKNEAGTPLFFITFFQETSIDIPIEDLMKKNSNTPEDSLVSSQIGFWEMDIKTHKINISHNFFELLGFSENSQDMILEDLLKVICIEDRQKIIEAFNRMLQGESKLDLQCKVKRIKTKKLRYLHLTGEVRLDRNGKPIRILGAYQDITENMHTSEELQKGRLDYSVLTENLEEGIAVHELVFDEELNAVNYRIIEVNHGFEKILGILRDEAVGKMATEVYGTSDAPYLAEYSEVSEIKKPYHFETYFAPMNKYFHISAAPWGTLGFISIFLDITERKKAIEQLKYSEARLQAMAENISDIICIQDTDSIVSYISPNVEKITGWKPEEIVGKVSNEFIHPEDISVSNSFFTSVIQNENKVGSIEARYQKKDGSYAIHDISATNMINDLNIQGVLSTFHDIGDRVRALNELKEETESYQALIESTDDMIWTVESEKFGIVHFNTALATYFKEQRGIKIEKGMAPEELLPTDYAALWKSMYARTIKDGPYKTEYKVLTKNKVLRLSFNPLYNNGKVFGISVFGEDTTEEINFKERLRESEEKFRNTFDQSPISKIIVGLDRHFLNCNQAFIDLLGYKIEDLSGKTDFEFTYPEDRDLGYAEYKNLLDGNVKSIRYEKRYIHKNGKIIWADLSLSMVNDINGNPKYYLVIVQDITEQKIARNIITESEAKFRSLFENSGVGIGYYTVDGTIISYNNIAASYMGGISSDFTGKCIYDLFGNDQGKEYMERIRRSAVTEEIIQFEDKISLPSGDEWFLSIYKRIKDADGKVTGIQVISHNVTEGKKADEIKQGEFLKYQSLIANISDVIFIADQFANFLYVSNGIQKITGIKPDELIGTSIFSLIHPGDRERVIQRFRKLFKSPQKYMIDEIRLLQKDKAFRYVEFKAINKLNNLDIKGILVTIHDITERKLSEIEYRTIIQTSNEGFWIANEEGKILDVNKLLCSMTGYSRNELLSMNIWDLDLIEESSQVRSRIQKIIEEGSDSFVTQKRCKDGSIIDVEVKANGIQDKKSVCAFLTDITERKKREQEIHYLNRHDVLTGLYNRAFFEEKLKIINEQGALPFSIIMGDINGLKLTNDVFGHAMGDKLLIETALILRKSCQEQEIIARMGGDEFVIILPQASEDKASEVCHKIYLACEKNNIVIGKETFQPSISLGTATKSDTGQDIKQILKEAEDMMYKRKLLERRSIHSSIVRSIRTTIFEKSKETREHADRLSALARALGEVLCLSDSQLYELELLAALHDIGKIAVDDKILSKPGKLSEQEWEEMRRHPEIGYRIALASPELMPIAECILSHHERWDGLGYPQGLSGRNIPLLARIISVLDAFDAMTNQRVYRKAMTEEEAIKEIRINANKQFDKEIVDAFLATKIH